MKLRLWTLGNPSTVGDLEVDMAPFIEKVDRSMKLKFPKCELGDNCVLNLEFKLTESNQLVDEEELGARESILVNEIE